MPADAPFPDPPRTWSMLVTIFGDLAPDGAWLSSPVLGALTAPMGIRPEALRTTLHRLRREGWIEGQREGRTTVHALTDWGQAQVRAAAPHIYAARGPDGLFVHLAEPGAALPDHAVPVAPGIGASTRADPEGLPAGDLPGWVRDRLGPADLMRAASDLTVRLRAVADGPAPDTPQEATVLRLRVVHDWRRLALRMPWLPDRALPAGWQGSAARSVVHELLKRFPAEEALTRDGEPSSPCRSRQT